MLFLTLLSLCFVAGLTSQFTPFSYTFLTPYDFLSLLINLGKPIVGLESLRYSHQARFVIILYRS